METSNNNKFILRPNQADVVQKARIALRTNKAVLLQAPTGFGKTAVGAHILGSAVSKKRHSLFIVHRRELIDQSIEAFDKEGIPHGTIAASYYAKPYEPVQICSIDTLKRRLHKIKQPDLIIWDEAHHMGAAGWEKVFNFFGSAKHIALTATPQRLDGKGLGKYFTHMVLGPRISELIEDGWLVDYKAFAPTEPDMSGVRSAMGEFVQAEAEEAMERSVIVGDIIEHYLTHARGRRFILFAPSIKYSVNVAANFRASNIMAVHVDGETEKNDRKAAMSGFRANNINGLCNVGLFGEGVDVPGAEILIDTSPSKSLTAVMQRWGRVLRPVYAAGFDLNTREGRLAAIAASPKPYAVILDHAGNIKRHGMPCDDRVWSLADGQKKKKNVEEVSDLTVKQCSKCYFLHRPAPKCPSCGFEYPIKHRVIEEVEGDLQELKKQERDKRLVKARTYEELLTEGISRGYDQKKAEWFANKILNDRKEWKTKIQKERYGSR